MPSLSLGSKLPSRVRIVEVGPRDGLQNEPTPIATATKVSLIHQLVDAGLTYIEAGSFVNPKWVPQMADSAEVFESLTQNAGVTYAALVPNLKGAERALSSGANELAIFAAASEAFSQKNINCSIEESLNRFEEVIALARAASVPVRGYISCVLGCPYSGKVDPLLVADIAERLLAMGCYEISLGDTIGVGTAAETRRVIEAVAERIPLDRIAVHMHDTYGQALSNVLTALSMGVHIVDSSIAGLGGCPYAKGATGNLATEDLVYLLNGLGIEHGTDLTALIRAGNFISRTLNKPTQSRVARALTVNEM
jgi:hydroxymethylglutaryl-CoA lyase